MRGCMHTTSFNMSSCVYTGIDDNRIFWDKCHTCVVPSQQMKANTVSSMFYTLCLRYMLTPCLHYAYGTCLRYAYTMLTVTRHRYDRHLQLESID